MSHFSPKLCNIKQEEVVAFIISNRIKPNSADINNLCIKHDCHKSEIDLAILKSVTLEEYNEWYFPVFKVYRHVLLKKFRDAIPRRNYTRNNRTPTVEGLRQSIVERNCKRKEKYLTDCYTRKVA